MHRLSAITAGALSLALLLSACGQPAPAAGPASNTTSPSTSPAAPTPATAKATTPTPAPINLFTHCGIYEVKVQDTYFAADNPLDDGNGNPPPGWGNPFQAGTVTVTGSEAIFRDNNGHTVTFHARPGATGFLRPCA